MKHICLNCNRFVPEYYYDEQNNAQRYSTGFCKSSYTRKLIDKTCKRFVQRTGSEPIEELMIRRQALLSEIKELTSFLCEIKFLAKTVKQIQEILRIDTK